MVEAILLLLVLIWVGWILTNLALFLIGVKIATYDTPTFDGFTIHIPERFVAATDREELAAAIMHEEGHRFHKHVWENLLRLFLFAPVSTHRRMGQEIEADDFVAKPEALAAFLRKTSTHPFDLWRAARLELRASRRVRS